MPVDTNPASDGETITNSVPIDIPRTKSYVDLITIFGLLGAMGLVVVAALIGESQANFFNLPSLMIVVFGTVFVTIMSYNIRELGDIRRSLPILFVRKSFKHQQMAEQLINLSVRAKKHGPLSLTKVEEDLKNDPFLLSAMQMVSDGVNPGLIEKILDQASETGHERKLFTATALRKAGEVAPGMGLIGTLVGLVQMLAKLDDPTAIGPAMAVALLTTFYGALLGTIILTPLAIKMERSVEEEALMQDLIRTSAESMAKQESPRQLEVLLNSLLPARSRISYF